MDSLALSNYMAIARWLTGLVDRTISQLPGSEPTDPFPGQEQANGLPWYWVFYPYLDGPEKQQESALHAGYVRVVDKLEADKVIAEKDKVIAELERQIEFLKVTHDACGNCNQCADGMGKVFDKYIKEKP